MAYACDNAYQTHQSHVLQPIFNCFCEFPHSVTLSTIALATAFIAWGRDQGGGNPVYHAGGRHYMNRMRKLHWIQVNLTIFTTFLQVFADEWLFNKP